MTTSIRTQTPPNVTNYPKVDIFNKDDFDQALWQNGYAITLYAAIACPCKGTSSDSKPTCSNCLGTGWVFINPIKTRAFITSINRTTKFKDWSPEYIGTVAVTFMYINRIGFMDKIILDKNYGIMSEVLSARTNPNNAMYGKFVFSTYNFVEINSVFVFDEDDKALIKLAPEDYLINVDNNCVLDIKEDNLPTNFNGKVSVTYKHNVQYCVLDLPHDMRITKTWNNNGKQEMQEMPVQAIARKAQYELGKASNYNNDNIQENSFL